MKFLNDLKCLENRAFGVVDIEENPVVGLNLQRFSTNRETFK